MNGLGLYDPFYVSWMKDVTQASGYPSVWFFAYWFGSELNVGGLSEMLMALFGLQLLTLGTVSSSLFVRRRIVKLVTVASGGAVVALMLYLTVNPLFQYYGSLRLGFWLAVLAEIVFVAELALPALRKAVSRSAPAKKPRKEDWSQEEIFDQQVSADFRGLHLKSDEYRTRR